MNKYKKFIILLSTLFMLVACQHCQPSSENDTAWLNIVDYAKKKLPHHGTLVQQSDGYAYLKVDDNYIHQLFPMLKEQGFEKPPYFRRANAPGAHISLVYKDEHVVLKEVGKTFTFEITDIALVHPKKDVSYIILQVIAPDLEHLRSRYGLSPKLKGHEFHITLAKSTKT